MVYFIIGSLYLISFISYGYSSYISVNPAMNGSLCKLLIALVTVNIANIGWLAVAYLLRDSAKVYLAGVTFDLMLSFAFIFPPLLFMGKEVPLQVWAGVVLVVIGLFLIKT